MTAARLTTVCGSCGDVLWEDEAAGHRCKRRLVAELEQRVADLEKRLAAAERAWELAAGIRGVPGMLTPGRREQAMASHPAARAARPASQVTRGPGRTARHLTSVGGAS